MQEVFLKLTFMNNLIILLYGHFSIVIFLLHLLLPYHFLYLRIFIIKIYLDLYFVVFLVFFLVFLVFFLVYTFYYFILAESIS